MSDISERILAAMKKAEMSYGELSAATGISKSMLQRYAVGDTGKIPLDRLQIIAEALGTTPEYLIGWEVKKTPDQERLEALHQNPKLCMLFDRQSKMSDDKIDLMYRIAEEITKEFDEN